MLDYFRLTPIRLPIFIIVASVVATAIDVVGFLVVAAIDRQTATEQLLGPELVFSFVGKLLGRAGPSFSVGIIAFIVAFLIARRIHDQPDAPWGREHRDTSSPAAIVAGVITMLGGLVALTSVTSALVPWAREIAASDEPGRPAEWIVSLFIAGLTVPSYVLAAIPVLLGLLIVCRVRWARYAIVIFFILLAAGLTAWNLGAGATIDARHAPVDWQDRGRADAPAELTAADLVGELLYIPVALIKRELPLFATGMIVVTGVLVWAALRERGSVGSLRECWRAVLNLVIQVPFLAVVVFAQVYDMFRPSEEMGLVFGYFAVAQSIGIIVMMFGALWALAYDENRFWARLNAWVIISSPVVLSLLGLIASIFQGVSLAIAG